jgi:hypothetical protein
MPATEALADLSPRYRTGRWSFATSLFDVYAGTDVDTDRDVQLRFLTPRFARNHEFAQEVIAAARRGDGLEDAEGVAVLDVGAVGGRLCVVTEAPAPAIPVAPPPATDTAPQPVIPLAPTAAAPARRRRLSRAVVVVVTQCLVIAAMLIALVVVAWNDTDSPTPGRSHVEPGRDLPVEIPR